MVREFAIHEFVISIGRMRRMATLLWKVRRQRFARGPKSFGVVNLYGTWWTKIFGVNTKTFNFTMNMSPKNFSSSENIANF
jgi:hypothetical protein